MCVWCAYTGNRLAAPLLLEAGNAEEGIWGGTFTGLVTLDGDGFHWDKCKGPQSEWRRQFGNRSYPGNCGIYHCRTNSGGNGLWAHPFVSSDRTVALAAQGIRGIFSKSPFVDGGNELLAAGVRFQGAIQNIETEKYPQLSDGSHVHSGEVKCETIAQFYRENHDPMDALRRTIVKMPSAAVTVCMFHDRPGYLYAANMNQRLALVDGDNEVWLTSSLEALDPTLFPITEISGNRLLEVAPGHIRIEKLADGFAVENHLPKGYIHVMLEYIRKNPGCTLPQITDQALAPMFSSEKLMYRAAAAHRGAEILHAEGLIVLKKTDVPTGVEMRYYPVP